MKKVRLMRMIIRNFKGIEECVFEPEGKTATISGRNGVGKTSVYDAYLWCLFGCTSRKNEVIQPLDSENNIRRGLQTSVEVTLEVDDAPITLRRSIDTEIRRFCNEVPLNAKKFDAKIEDIFPKDKWSMLSNINVFMSMTVDTRRSLLLELFSKKDAVKVPESVSKELAKGKTLEELEIQIKKEKKQAEKELDAIPIAMQSQDKLIISDDFDALRQKALSLEREMADIDVILQASSKDMEAMLDKRKRIQELEAERMEAAREWWASHNQVLQWLQDTLRKEKQTLADEESAFSKAVDAYLINQEKLSVLESDFAALKQKWQDINNEQPPKEDMSVCPTCGRPFNEEESERYASNMLARFNEEKSVRLQKIVDDATVIKGKMIALKGSINEFETVTKATMSERIKNAKEAVKDMQTKMDATSSETVDSSARIKKIAEEIVDLQAALGKATTQGKEEYENQKADLKLKLSEVQKRLSAEETNKRIRQEKERLQERANEISQNIAYFDAIVLDIKRYKADVINYTENIINARFAKVKWKFAEQNITNDEVKKICDCLIDGVPYHNLNTAAKINAGMDIVIGLSKGYDVSLPLFVDNRESVLEVGIDTSNYQVIYLKVTNDQNLLITF